MESAGLVGERHHGAARPEGRSGQLRDVEGLLPQPLAALAVVHLERRRELDTFRRRPLVDPDRPREPRAVGAEGQRSRKEPRVGEDRGLVAVDLHRPQLPRAVARDDRVARGRDRDRVRPVDAQELLTREHVPHEHDIVRGVHRQPFTVPRQRDVPHTALLERLREQLGAVRGAPHPDLAADRPARDQIAAAGDGERLDLRVVQQTARAEPRADSGGERVAEGVDRRRVVGEKRGGESEAEDGESADRHGEEVAGGRGSG